MRYIFQDSATPLYMAARDGHTSAAELLIAKGANVHAEDKVKVMVAMYHLLHRPMCN